MAYEPIEYDPEQAGIPDVVAAFIGEADRRCDEIFETGLNKRFPRYLPSEPAQVYSALKFVTDRGLAPGDRFLEWGSGLGTATGLAALLGYEATGIELQPDLVERARELVRSQGVEAEFIATSYIPEGLIAYECFGTADLVRDGPPEGQPLRYEEMDADIEEVDLFFAYPWPGEQEMMLKLFDTLAGDGAVLVAYFAADDICLYRKVVGPEPEPGH